MTVKKMLGVAAIATAALVVPAQAQAEATTTEENLFNLGEGVTSAATNQLLTISYSKDDTALLFDTIEWYIGETKIEQASNKESFKIPYKANNQSVKAVVKLKDEETFYTQTIFVAANEPTTVEAILANPAAKFGEVLTAKPVDSNGKTITGATYEWYVGDEKQATTSNSFSVPFSNVEQEIKVIVIDSNEQAYTDSITVSAIINTDVSFSIFNEEDGWGSDTTAKANDEIRANVTAGGTIASINWYIVGDGKSSFLAKTDTLNFDVPLIAQGYTLRAIITMEPEVEVAAQYYADLEIEEVTLEDASYTPVILVGGKEITNSQSLAAKDQLAVSAPDLEAFGLLASQVTISYQWYFTDEHTSLKIPNATDSKYTIPEATKLSELSSFKVHVTIEVPELQLQKTYASGAVGLNDDDVNQLITKINTIPYDDFEFLKKEIADIKEIYTSLSPGSQQLVTNYGKVKEAEASLQLITPLITKLTLFTEKLAAYNTEEILTNHSQLVKEITAIDNAYNALNSLQQELVNSTSSAEKPAELIDLLMKYVADSANEKSTAKLIDDLNSQIRALISDEDTSVLKSYLVTRSDLAASVKQLEAAIKKVEKTYQPLLKTAILKAASADIKKAEAVAKDIQTIESTADNKKSSLAEKIRVKYNKLTPLQKSLISGGELEKIAAAEEPAAEKKQALQAKIDTLLTSNGYDFNSAAFTSGSLNQAVEALISEYKALGSAERKQINNYAAVSQLKKDISAAERVKKSIVALNQAIEDIENATDEKQAAKKEKAAYSKYLSAFKAYAKLTPLQQSIFESDEFTASLDFNAQDYFNAGNSFEDLLLSVPEPSDDEESDKPIPSVDNALDLVEAIEGFYSSVLSGSLNITDAETELASLQAQYKTLLSPEKKNVYNYSLLSTTKSAISKAKSTLKKINAASTPEKRVGALEAYKKLATASQGLLTSEYMDLLSTIDVDNESKIPTTELITKIDELATSDMIVDLLNELKQTIATLSTKELKALPNYKYYQNALKDLNVAEKFVGKVQKLGSAPTYSKKQAILTDFDKLTAMQAKMVNSMTVAIESDVQNVSALLTSWTQNAEQASTELNTTIGNIISGNEYTISATSMEEFKATLAVLEAQYKALDSKERKLVTNYKLLRSISSDINKVAPVLVISQQLAEASTEEKQKLHVQLENAYKRLSLRQVSLYKGLGGQEPSDD